MKLSAQQDRDAVNLIRGLAMDAPLAAKSGHQGTAMALAPLGHVLYSRVMRHDPKTLSGRTAIDLFSATGTHRFCNMRFCF